MTTVGNVNFCGTQANQYNQPNYSTPQLTSTNFKAKKAEADTYNGKTKKSHPLNGLVKLAIATGVIIGGLGYTHKAGWVNKLGEGKVSNWVKSATKKCHEWCSWTKGKGTEGWEWVKTKLSKGDKKA